MNTDGTVKCYAEADELRKEILRRPLQLTNHSVDQLVRTLQKTNAIDSVAELQTPETKSRGGILSNDVITQANDLLEILNGK